MKLRIWFICHFR